MVIMWVFEVKGLDLKVSVFFVVGYLLGEYFVLVVVGSLDVVIVVKLLCVCGDVM